jgi:hypothetical protein
VEGGESAREAARVLEVGASTAIRWIERWTTTGSVDAKPGTGRSRSPLEKHKQWLLDLVATQPDLTLCRSASNPDPPLAPDSAKPSGATLRCAPPDLARRPHNLEGGQLFDADPGQSFGAV